MAYAISAWFSPDAEAQLRSLWRELHDAGISSALHQGPYRPHVTLGIYEPLDVNASQNSLSTLWRNVPPLTISLSYVGLFPNSRAVGFLAATVTDELLRLHQSVHAIAARHGSGPTPYYLPGCWNPHCTLAPDLDDASLPRFVAWTRTLALPIIAPVTRLGIIETPAEVELAVIP